MGRDAPHAALAPVLVRQQGAFTREQARQAGFSDSRIDRYVASGRWIRAHHGVYRDRNVARTPEQDAIAACLAAGERSVASHRTAARLWGLNVPAPEAVEVTLPWNARSTIPSIRPYRSRHLGRLDVARLGNVPITTPSRTLLDLASCLDASVLEIALDTFWRRRSLSPERLAPYLWGTSSRSRPGAHTLRVLVGERVGKRPPGSDLETVAVRALRDARVPEPVRQHPVRTRVGLRRLDLAYPDHMLGIELDGFDWHARDRRTFDDDRVRQSELERLGWTFKRFTWTHVTRDRIWMITTVAEALGLTPVRWRRAGGTAQRAKMLVP